MLHRLHRLAPQWDSSLRLSKRGVPPNSPGVISVPQGSGIPGWLILTRDPTPIAYFVDRNEAPQPIRIVWDTRCFEDTVLRVEKTPTHLYLADVWMLNGAPIFDISTFAERQELLGKLFGLYTPCPGFETLAIDMRTNVKNIRGTEYYSDRRGAYGIFVDSEVIDVVRTDVPDVYKVVHTGEYLRVPTLALSRYLGQKGAAFKIPCKNNRDGTWTVDIPSKSLTNEKQKNEK